MPAAERAQLRERHKESRDERRAHKVRSLHARWGASLLSPEVQAELRLHAERVARLRRMQIVAEDHGKVQLQARVGKLMQRERQRHLRVMTQLRRDSDGTASSAAAPTDDAPGAPEASARPATKAPGSPKQPKPEQSRPAQAAP